ncbi:MAG: zinc ribbon domain-containing protein [Methanobrevibacter sp.]|nr:zinc ribbon domain-containing protein [Methanobrevibacter sp.]MBO7443447.1 zinc ribbon domain-containing protein [Methanobrevibacter sp.]
MVKYCQECGNASYDSAPVCGNCGAKLPPKSEANARPPKLEDKFKPGVITSTNDSIFSGNSSSFGKGLSSKISGFDLSKFSSVSREKEQSHAQAQKSTKPSFSKTATEGFKQKDKGIKDPAKKFSSAKTETITREIKKESPKKDKVKKSIPKKEKKAEPTVTKKSDGGSGINIRKIAIVAILAIIILLIAGIGLNGLQNQTTDEVKNYSDGIISFDYSGNWSMYNNTDGNSNSSDIAFKTKDNTLIGFTTIQSDDITYEKIISDINATSQSLNGEVLEAETVDVGGIPSLEMTISTADQGYSRYFCTLRDGVYYSFVINNGKSSNQDISALNTTEIQNMINSISFQTTEYDAEDGAEIA